MREPAVNPRLAPRGQPRNQPKVRDGLRLAPFRVRASAARVYSKPRHARSGNIAFVAPRPEPNKWARLEFPDEFRLGMERFAELAGWRVRRTTGQLRVTTQERYEGVTPQLIRLRRIADQGSADDPRQYEPFRNWIPQADFAPAGILGQVLSLPEVKAPANVVDAWLAFRLQFMAMPDADVPGYMRDLFSQAVKTSPRATLWSIEIDPRFRWRVVAVRALFAARETPEVLKRDPASEEGLRFFSSQGLSQAWSYGQAVFFEPILLAAAPWISGISSYRAGGTAVILFGGLQSAFSGKQATEGLDLFQAGAMARPRAGSTAPEFEAAQYEAALGWWVGRLNHLFGIALDVGRYVDATGTYQPAAHLGVLLSLERLFASVETILTEARGSELVRLMLFFDVIDLLDGLTFGSWDSLLRRDRVEKTANDLRTHIPGRAADYLLFRCSRAVAALGELERGFVLHERVENGMLQLRQKDGVGWQSVPLASAVPQYLRIARNSTHSFRQMARDPREVSLLAAHDGDIPDAISDLALLQLLNFLADPRLPTY